MEQEGVNDGDHQALFAPRANPRAEPGFPDHRHAHLFGTQIGGYFSGRTFNRITTTVAIIAVVAVGETLVILTRNYMVAG